MLSRFLTSLSLCSLFVVAPLAAQDTVWPAVGGSFGLPFDSRAPAATRISSVQVRGSSWIDGLNINYADRFGVLSQVTVIGSLAGQANTFNIPAFDYLVRIELWYDAGLNAMRGITLQTHGGYRQDYGIQVGAFQAQQAPPYTEIIGLHGTFGSMMNSIGMTTRPVLARSQTFGNGCAGNLGVPQIRYRQGAEHIRLNNWTTIVEVTNVPGQWAFLFIGFTALPAGVPLAGAGAPGCTGYLTPDIVQLVGADPNQTAGHTFFLPNTPSLIGAKLSFQGGVPSTLNALGLAFSNAMTGMCGAI